MSLGYASAAAAADIPIEQINHVFSKPDVTLSSGDALIVQNNDGTAHDLSVIDENGDPQDLGIQEPGKVLRIKFSSFGHFTVRCALTP